MSLLFERWSKSRVCLRCFEMTEDATTSIRDPKSTMSDMVHGPRDNTNFDLFPRE